VTARQSRRRCDGDVDVVGVPTLELRDEDLEAISDVLADALVEALEREAADP
jgi:hypothetical protein